MVEHLDVVFNFLNGSHATLTKCRHCLNDLINCSPAHTRTQARFPRVRSTQCWEMRSDTAVTRVSTRKRRILWTNPAVPDSTRSTQQPEEAAVKVFWPAADSSARREPKTPLLCTSHESSPCVSPPFLGTVIPWSKNVTRTEARRFPRFIIFLFFSFLNPFFCFVSLTTQTKRRSEKVAAVVLFPRSR